MKEKVYRKIFRDIVRGYSSASLDNKTAYIKHVTTHDQVNLEDVYDNFYTKAEIRGIPTEKNMTNFLISEGDWSEKDQKDLEAKLDYIQRLEQSKKHLILKREIDNKNKEINECKEEYLSICNMKDNMLGGTCEKYATERTNDYYIVKSFFKNEHFDEPFFSQDDYDDMSVSEIRNVSSSYSKVFNNFTENNIKHLILQDFYYPYFPFSEDVIQFFGVPAVKLTKYQINLIIYTRVIKNVLEKHNNIPEEVRKDPDKLLDYSNISEKAKDEFSKHEDKPGASTVFGAKKEDYEYMNINSAKKDGSVSLREAAEKKGGRLSMEDMMKLSGA